MSSALVIGSTVCDVMVYLDRLPSREGDAILIISNGLSEGVPLMLSISCIFCPKTMSLSHPLVRVFTEIL